jgi:hypothetical protein
MVDRLQDENIDELLLDRLIPVDGNLNFPCIAVINRFHSDRHSLEDNEKLEAKWFAEVLNGCPQTIMSRCGSNQLLIQMDKFYNNFIESQWIPNVTSKIDIKIAAAEKNEAALGVAVSMSNLKEFTIQLHRRISKAFFENQFFEPISIKEETESEDEDDLLDFNGTWPGEGISLKYHRYVEHIKERRVCNSIDISNAFAGEFSRFEACKEMMTRHVNYEYSTKLHQLDIIKNRLIDMIINAQIADGPCRRNFPIQHIDANFEWLFKSLVLHPMRIKPTIKLADFVESPSHQAKRVLAKQTIRSLIQLKTQISSMI